MFLRHSKCRFGTFEVIKSPVEVIQIFKIRSTGVSATCMSVKGENTGLQTFHKIYKFSRS